MEPTVKTQKKVLDTVLEDREDIDYYEGMIEKDEFDAITRASRTDAVLYQGHNEFRSCSKSVCLV